MLNLFLPIVVFLFGLWFLLALKLCILPSFEFDGGLQAELALIPPKIGVDAGFEVDVDAPGFQVTVGGSVKNGVQVNAELVDDRSRCGRRDAGLPEGHRQRNDVHMRLRSSPASSSTRTHR